MSAERKREREEERKRQTERQNVDVMPITSVDGVGLADGDSEGGSRGWWRKRRWGKSEWVAW